MHAGFVDEEPRYWEHRSNTCTDKKGPFLIQLETKVIYQTSQGNCHRELGKTVKHAAVSGCSWWCFGTQIH